MKLLEELIHSLPNQAESLTGALLKTRVLLHDLGRPDLAEWVGWELNGYPDSTTLPDYRKIPAHVVGSLSNLRGRYTNYPLPLFHLTATQRESLESLEIAESIEMIEQFAKNDKGQYSRPIPVEFNHLIGVVIGGGFKIESAKCVIGVGQFGAVLTQVRSRLLQFLLDLRDKFGKDTSPDRMREVSSTRETGELFSHAIFGNNTTILVGSHNRQTVTHGVSASDLASLVAALSQNGIEEDDLLKLDEAIRADSDSDDVVAKKRFGPAVRGWINSMLSKAVNSAWSIELGVAANLLTDALRHYYNF